MRRIIASFLFFICLQAGNVYADNSSLDINIVLEDLERIMSGTKTIQADFIQEKSLALFNQKIILKGKVFIQKPGRFSWRVMSPKRYSIVINGSTIRQWDEDTNQVQQVSLSRNFSFRVAIEQMQNWFCGTFKAMLNDYKITLTTKQPISLEFIPLKGSVSRNFIERVSVLFQDDAHYIKKVHIKEKSGDSTSLVFINTQLNQPILSSAWKVKTDVR
ncbi:MAG: outer membrane lipoprotein carrier protein LolA [Candidatus Omnitrophica bacterium]|nr:outer membrane lipoprotein carrier protein LolA [Candidatus Omnitrophota bacterium]